ncbi:MAG TPA: phosphoribosylformylglycinamidine synthase subunit PurL [Longimicrobiales bacterium]|nr:phosphoribosylformylglycinamidine synthase subunit PurL [Longimicrobiales bacterium]
MTDRSTATLGTHDELHTEHYVEPRPGDPEITAELIADHGLSASEYSRITSILARTPTYTELGVFSAMWSEHCGYKNSKPLLRTLPTEAPWVLQGPGENAGVIDVGDGLAVAFKIESHNHPSAVEPYQGAATGVGGILRDVFTMGARPIAVLDSLRFGSLTNPRVRYLFAGVVKGIGDYGNCVGIPNVGGEVFFDEAYEGNPLVNAMAIGLMKHEGLITGIAAGVGNPIIAVGARTGRDGIHGATFASVELSEESEASRPQVQVGDPFTEKLLLEASLELIASGHIVGIQDMGAAGLVSSSTEMAARGGTGVDIDVTKMPVREAGMTPYEILLSESQERMLVVAHAGREEQVRAILEKWELEAAVIGVVTSSGRYRVFEGDRLVVDLPGEPLVNECPTYTREGVESDDVKAAREYDPLALCNSTERQVRRWESEGGALKVEASVSRRPLVDATGDALTAKHPFNRTLLRLLASPNIASKRWVYEQYDSTVRTNTAYQPGGDAGVLRLRGTKRGIAATTDCNGRWCWLDPYEGAKAAVAEAARNLACVGARPRAITNNLNFGNPTKPDVYWQMSEAVAGMGYACRALETPVTGGNVSLYNENPRGAIFPTPTVGMIGVLDDVSKMVTAEFKAEGDAIILLGLNTSELGGSEWLHVVHGKTAGRPPRVSLDAHRALIEAMLDLADRSLLRSAHDVSEGGLAIALAESAVLGAGPRTDPYHARRSIAGNGIERSSADATPGTFGVSVTLEDDRLPPEALLFGEATGRIVVSCDAASVDDVLRIARTHGVPARTVGSVGAPGGAFNVKLENLEQPLVDLRVDQIAEVYYSAIPRLMEAAAGLVALDVEHPAMPR